MLARAVFFDKISDGEYLYNSYNGNRCNIGIVGIGMGGLSIRELAKVQNHSLVLINIPDEVEALYNMTKIEHKLFEKDNDTYMISTPYIEKKWVISDTNMPRETYNFICFNRSDDKVLDRYFYTRYIKSYLNKHATDLYTINYLYNLMNCIGDYIAVTEFDKKVQERLLHIICLYLKERNIKGKPHSDEYLNYFGSDDKDDEVFDRLSSPSTLAEYLRDIIVDYEINTLNGSIIC